MSRKTEGGPLCTAWIKALQREGLATYSIATYEQSLQKFRSMLDGQAVPLHRVRRAHVSDFALDRFRRGNSVETTIHFVDCIRQFFRFHFETLGVDPVIFSPSRIRTAYSCFRKAGISQALGNPQSDVGQDLTPQRIHELKALHKRLHPRG